MNEISPSHDPAPKRLRLVARIWSAPIIIVTFFIAIGNIWSALTNGASDPHAVGGTTFIETLSLMLMLFSAIGLALAWRWEKIGGGLSLAFTLGVVIVLVIRGNISGDQSNLLIPYILSLAFLVPGILFLLYGLKTKKQIAYT
jgi:hypothetical protein